MRKTALFVASIAAAMSFISLPAQAQDLSKA